MRTGRAQVHGIMPITEDPVEVLFNSILDDPEGLLAPVSQPLALPTGRTPEDEVLTEAEATRSPIPPANDPKPRNSTMPPRRIREGLELLI